MGEPGKLQSTGMLRVQHNWVTSLSLFTFMHWRRKWHPTPVFLPGESQGRGAWWATVYRVAQSQTWLKRLSSSSSSSSDSWCWRSFHVLIGCFYVFLGEMFVHILCPFFNWVVCLFCCWAVRVLCIFWILDSYTWFADFVLCCLVAKSCLTVCNPMDSSPPDFPVLTLPEFAHTQVHWVSDAIQPSHPLSSPFLPALSRSQH